MSDPKVIYLGPACEAETGDGRTWAEDSPWPDCECGHRPVQYVHGDTFERMKAERNALQLLLNNRDDLDDQLASLEQRRYAEQQAREAAERDAARYRWLRGRNLETIQKGGVFAGVTPENMVINGVDLDNAIDAAIEAALSLASETESQSPAPGYAPSPQQ